MSCVKDMNIYFKCKWNKNYKLKERLSDWKKSYNINMYLNLNEQTEV